MRRNSKITIRAMLMFALILSACGGDLEGGRKVIEGQVRPFIINSESGREVICETAIFENQLEVGDEVTIQVRGTEIPLSTVGMYGGQPTTLYMDEYDPGPNGECQPEKMKVSRTDGELLMQYYFTCTPVDLEGVYGTFECKEEERVGRGVEK